VTPLDADQRRGIAVLLRAHAELQRRLSAAIALLSFCQRNEKYPKDFRAELERAKTHPDYAKIGQGYDIVAFHLEQSADEIDVSEVLSRLPKGSVN
jgi:hypothetical protein